MFLASEQLEARWLPTVIPLGRLVEEPQRLTDVLDTTTKIAEYSFVADAGDLVSVAVNALSSADLLLSIYADDVAGVPAGKQIAFGDDASASTRDPSITAVLTASGTYRIMVSVRRESGFAAVASQFRLTASRQASSFTVPAGASGRAGGHAFTIAQTGVLDVTFGSAQWQPTAQPQLFDAAGTVIATAGLPDASGRARLSQYVTPGDYVVSHAMPLARDTAVSMRFAGASALQSPWGPQAAGEDPSFMILADIDGDTLEDLIVANPTLQRGSDAVSVLLGRPQGRFADRQEFEVPGGVEAGLGVRDVNGDTIPDIITVGTDDGTAESVGAMSVLFGRGDGTFSPAIPTPLGGRPKAMAMADFNGDGFVDAAIATGGIVTMLRNARDGRFLVEAAQETGLDSIGSLVVAAMNRDGAADLVVVGQRAMGDEMVILRGDGQGSFTTAAALPLDFHAGMTIAADVDGDEISDLAIVNKTAGAIEVFRGGGDGGLSARRTLTVGAEPTTVAAGSVDDDGNVDLVVSCATPRGLYLLPGSGNGAFREPRNLGGCPKTGMVALADLDDDRRTDLVYRDLGLDAVRFIIQGPGGTFDDSNPQSVDRGPAGIMAGDFNGDGRPDVATVNSTAGTLSVLLGKGDGGFAPQRSYAVGRDPRSGAVADINGDGRLDVVVANQGENFVSVMFGLGDGRLGDASTILAGGRPSSVALADLDGDRLIDLVVGGRGEDDEGFISVMRGRGAGRFHPARSFSTGTLPTEIVLAKVDANESLDIFVLGNSSSGYTATPILFLGDGSGGFSSSEMYLGGLTSPVTLDAADINADGILDIVTGSNVMSRGESDDGFQYHVQVSFGRGDGTFEDPLSLSAGRSYYPRRVRASDVSGDGRLDIVSTNIDPGDGSGGMLTVYAQLADGSFTQGAAFYPSFNQPVDFITSDLNDDGYLDLVTANFGDDALSTFLGGGSWWQTVPVYVSQIGFTDWSPSTAVPADVNGDGLLDLVLATRIKSGFSFVEDSGYFGEVLLGRADGTFIQGQTPPLASRDEALGDKFFIPAAADLDGDGIVDLVTADSSYSWDFFGFNQGSGSTVTVHFGAGRGMFRTPLTVPVGQRPSGLAIADLNHDGLQDILSANAEDDSVSILYGLEGRGFAQQQVIPVGTYPTQLKIHDIDGDGWLDIVTGNQGRENADRTVSIVRGRPDHTFAPAVFMPVSGGRFSLDVADVNEDGCGDVAVTSLVTSSVYVFHGTRDGQLVSAREFFVGQYPRDILLEDFDRDGHIDIVTANYLDGTLSVLRGRGKGSFLEQLVIPITGSGRGGVAVVDGGTEPDGRPRLIAVNHDGQNIVTVPGGTGGTLQPQLQQASFLKFIMNAADNLAFGSLQKAIPLDADGSGPLDVLSLDRHGAITVRTTPGAAGVSLPPPNGGTFTGRGVDACAMVGADGRDRAAVIDRRGTTVFIVTVNPSGAPVISQTLSARKPATLSEPSSTLSRVAAADLNRDGWADLIVSNPGTATIDILISSNDGSFDDTAWQRLSAGAGVSQLLVRDINGDDVPDLVAANQISGMLTVRYGIGRAPDTRSFTAVDRFTAEYRFATLPGLHHYVVDPLSGSNSRAASFRISALAVGDVDGDGLQDMVTANGDSRTITVMHSDPAGGFQEPRVVIPAPAAGGFTIRDIACGDFDGDGRDDLALLDGEREQVLIYASRRNPDLTGVAHVIPLTRTMPRSIKVIDTTGPGDLVDGILDLVIGNDYGDVLTLQGAGDGTFASYVRADRSVALVATDIDGDGKDDFLYGSKGLDRIWMERSASQQTFEADQKKGVLGPSAVATVTETVGGREFKNLVVANGGANQILVFRSDTSAGATGPFMPDPQMFYVGTNPSAVSVADIDKDGLADVVVANEGSNDVSVMLGVRDATGRWTLKAGPRLSSGGSAPAGIAVGDFAGNDGVPDIAVTNRGSNSAAILRGIAGGFFNDITPAFLPISIPSPGPIVALPSVASRGPVIVVGSTTAGQFQSFNQSGSGYTATGTYSGGGAALATTTFRGTTYLAVGNSATGSVSIFLGGVSSLRNFAEAKGLPGLTSLAFDSAGRLYGVSPTSGGALALFGFNASGEGGPAGTALNGLLQTVQAFTTRIVFTPLTVAGVGLVAALVTSEGVALADRVQEQALGDSGDGAAADGSDGEPEEGTKDDGKDGAESEAADAADKDSAAEPEAESNPLLDFILDAKSLLLRRNRRLIESLFEKQGEQRQPGDRDAVAPDGKPDAAKAQRQPEAAPTGAADTAATPPAGPAGTGEADINVDPTARTPAAWKFRAVDVLPLVIAVMPSDWGKALPRTAIRSTTPSVNRRRGRRSPRK